MCASGNFLVFVDDRGKLRSRPQNTEYYFREAITWPLITSGGLSARYRISGSIHDVSGMSGFSASSDDILYVVGLVNTKIGNDILKILNPTINSQVGDFQNIPVLKENTITVKSVSSACIQKTKEDWDAYEESWNFTKHPLI